MEAITATPLGDHPPWQDLPPELLGLVIQRVPSHASRVRVRAVCRSWRAGARLHPPLRPPLPWLTLCDGTFRSLPDGAVHRVPVPDDALRILSTGGMLFIVHNDGRCSLVNPFSRNTAPQQVHAYCFRHEVSANTPPVYNVRKVVVMPDHIITISEGHGEVFSIRGQRQSSMTVMIQLAPPVRTLAYVVDITLFQEKLYVLIVTLVSTIDLYIMDIVDYDRHVNLECILSAPLDNDDQHCTGMRRYLVASGDRLLMVKQKGWDNAVLPSLLMPAQFDVFEAADVSSGCEQWRKVDTLLGRALFVSKGCSESLPAGDQYVGAQEDSIYFLSKSIRSDCMLPAIFSGIYNMREGTLSPLPFDTAVAQDGPGTTSWLFPPYT